MNSLFTVASLYPTNDLLSISMLSCMMPVFIFNYAFVCVLLLNMYNSPVSPQLRNSAIQAVTEVLS